jgi:hypothetical protein
MNLFRTADAELDDEESNVEHRLREFAFEDPDESLDPESEDETAFTGDKRKQYANVHPCYAKLPDIPPSGTGRAQKDHGSGLGDLPHLPGSGGLIYGGKSCNATSSLGTVILLCGTLLPTQMAHINFPPLDNQRQEPCRRQNLDENGGRRPRRRTLMLQTRHSLA